MAMATTNQTGNSEESGERLLLSESDVVHLLLEYLGSRGLTTSQLELEREAGVINEVILSPDLIFLRSLVVDGRWDDVIEFLQPLEEAFRTFPGKKVRATVLKHAFLDKMLTVHGCGGEKCGPHGSTGESVTKTEMLEELVKVLKELEGVCDSKEEYSSLCLLLTSPSRLAEHPDYRDWKSSTARLACFTHLKPLVQRFIPPPSAPLKRTGVSANDRLIQLLIKGLLYEACVEYCQSKAVTGESKSQQQRALPGNVPFRFPSLLNQSQLSESDLSLFSWLRSIPNQIFGCPFQRRSLRVDVEPLQKPERPLLNMSIMESASDLLSRSMASTSFHLSSTETQTDFKTMTTSVDRLFGDQFVDSFHQNNPSNKSHGLLEQKSATPSHMSALKDNNKPSFQNNSTPSKQSATRTLSTHSTDSQRQSNNNQTGNTQSAKFIAVTSLEDVQAVRCAEFHPHGGVYAIGSNSKTLRVCAYPNLSKLTENHVTYQPTVLFKRTKHHKGSIYCLGWSPDGNLLATGSNDKTVKLLRFEDLTSPELTGSSEVELSMHDGTVRDICFVEETSNKSSLLVSGGAGDCKIYVTDCATATPFQAMSGHTGPILSLYCWGGAIFCSGSQDKTIRFWDLRTRGCVDIITPLTSTASTKSPVASICVESSGRLLIAGHEDAAMVLYDIRGQRQIQSIKTHTADVRSVRFSPAAYYLLSGAYDNKIVLTDLQGDLSLPLPAVPVASHQDKVISGRWHPTEFTFLSTSADKTCCLWALPPEP